MTSERDEGRLQKLREMLAMLEDGKVRGVPSTAEAIRQLRDEITATEEGRSTMIGQPGAYVVGEPFPGGYIPPGTVGFYPPEGTPAELILGMDSPTPEDLEAFRTEEGWVEFALVPIGKLLVTMFRFPSKKVTEKAAWGLWCDSPWAHRKDSWFNLEPLAEGEDSQYMRYGVHCVLVDSDTSRVAALRFFTLSPHYSRVYHHELAERLNAPPVTNDEFLRLANEYQARYPDPKKMLDRAIVRCKAGLLGK